MVDVLGRYSRENGYVLVLDSSAQGTPILYASTQIDVTQDIIRLYDQAYTVTAAAAAPAKPAAAKPAQTTSQPPASKPYRSAILSLTSPASSCRFFLWAA